MAEMGRKMSTLSEKGYSSRTAPLISVVRRARLQGALRELGGVAA